MRGPGWGSRLAVNGALVLTAIYFLFPVWWLLVSATKSNPDLFSTNGFWFAEMNLVENVKDVFVRDSGLYPRWFGNSVGYGVAAAIGATLTSGACGYVLAKFRFPGDRLIFGCVVAGLLIPGALLTVPLYLVAASVGLTNTIWAIIIPSLVSPFGVFLCRVFAQGAVPDEIIESARMDGAGDLRIFGVITARIMSPALATVALFSFVGAWNGFMLPLIMLTDKTLYPVTLGLYAWQADKGQATYNLILAGSLVMVVPLVIGFFLMQRFWRTGLTLGAVKG
ncbi:carbohydrate ABC transporter permease [Cellulomonas wangsupingiae]|uniref:Carbohydrate ABC transporter permease n=1 Tax=Cellulomonas wangsupingiae TaxID=2968085 RepID=A0ABY5KDK4_9CELL|nr:carbohydrate ABC transporter permease [Cellulomonas wangsupingiae]MCC2336660.1 carbohydrate ABC transporter permease [Cellulomonas wangsupingiae]MCM0640499.1 carbohydrate ABC transporter permease [Cellulomonas wangsupingiae]UUI67086.1 carbohydrate ABC transporter permease [Cellulomonas wangsupingiae]